MILSNFLNQKGTFKDTERLNVSSFSSNDQTIDYGNLLGAISFFFRNAGTSNLPEKLQGTNELVFSDLRYNKDTKMTSVNVSGDENLKKQFLEFMGKYGDKVKINNNTITYDNKLDKSSTNTGTETDIASNVKQHMFKTKIAPYLAPALQTIGENKTTEPILEEIKRIKKLINND